jgi:hypothetical protein
MVRGISAVCARTGHASGSLESPLRSTYRSLQYWLVERTGREGP